LITLGSGQLVDKATNRPGGNFQPGGFSPPKYGFIIPGAWRYRSVDLRLRKDFPNISGTSMAVTADLFNSFNFKNCGCYDTRTFHYFWDLTNTANGLTPDRSPTPSFSSIAAVGFALTAYPIGVERGYITRADAGQRVVTTLRFFWTAPQDSAASGSTGYHGFFYHFLDMNTG